MTVKPAVHVYVSDGQPDPYTHQAACRCGLPRTNARHTMPEPPAEARVIDARVNGEHETE